jgi:hypothetical protein
MSAERRLLRDFKELAANPLLSVTAAPLENNIFEWHGNRVYQLALKVLVTPVSDWHL